MSFLLAAFACGMVLAQLQPVLPEQAIPLLLVLVPAMAALVPPALWARRLQVVQVVVPVCLIALGDLLGCEAAQLRRATLLPRDAADQVVMARAWVSSLPVADLSGQRLTLTLMEIDPAHGRPARVAVFLPTAGPHALPPLPAGTCAYVTLRLRPVHGLLNFSGFDAEGWQWAAGIGASGTVLGWQPCPAAADFAAWRTWWQRAGAALVALRAGLRSRLLLELGEAPCRGILVALAVGDQSGVTAGQWTVLWRSGVGHLVSISGVHVTLLAGLLSGLVRLAWRRSVWLSARLPATRAASCVALLAAVAYALVAGFAIPAQRTLFMLAATIVLQWRGVQAGGGRVFWLALTCTLLLDPFAPCSPSFWLSFAAVGGLVLADWGRVGQRPGWQQEWQAEWVANLTLLPLIALWFGQLSVVSPLANAVAVPLVSLLVMPLTLLALVPGLTVLIHLPECLCEWLLAGLAWLAAPGWACLPLAQPALWVCLLCAFAVPCLLLPMPLPGRAWAWLALLPVLWPASAAPAPGQVQVTVIDVGQGLAVLVRTAGHALLFDTGPRWPGGDTGTRVLLPLLQAEGVRRLDRLVLSHPDADHVGGADSLLAGLPVATVLSGYDRPQAQPCLRGQHWQWDGVAFDMLYPDTPPPPAGSPASRDSHLRNNHACVLRVAVGEHRVLLPADIEQPAETALLALEGRTGDLRSDVVVLAHHGSKTSSTPALVTATSAQWAIVSAGWRNHFHHPAPAVVARWQAAGARVLRTDQTGAIRITLGDGGLVVDTARAARAAWWR